jgi:hypothetical protein
MRFLKGHFLSVAWLSMLCLSTGSFADDLIRCVDEKTLETLESEDPCKFYRINDGRTASLWVVPEGEDPKDKSLAVPGAEFFVYAPQEQKLDSIKLRLKSDDSEVKNLTAVTAADDGLVKIGVSSPYGVYNINLGTSDDDVATRPIVSIVYNFYVPRLKYIVKGEEVTDVSKLQYEVGDTMHVDVEAIIPMGPKKASLIPALRRRSILHPLAKAKT